MIKKTFIKSWLATKVFIMVCFLIYSSTAICQINTYKDSTQSVEYRVNDLLKKMTLDEKIAQLRHIHQGNFDNQGKFSLQRFQNYVDGKSYGAFEAFGYSAQDYLKTVSTINSYLKNNTRLSIPAIPVMESLHGVVQDGCTIFPQSIAIAATFDPDLCYEMAVVIAKEMKAIGAKQTFAPVLDLARELRWGRVEETYGEDPFLVSKMGINYVKGIRSENLIATPKHFIAHGSPNGGLNLASVEGGKNALMNIYLQPFKKVFEQANPLSVMNCYSSYEGEPIAGSKYFLTSLLRDTLKFKGYVYSDWGSIGMLNYFQHTAQNEMEAAYQAIVAGMDLEAASDTYRYLKHLVENKILDEKYIDRAVKNILYVKFACGLFDESVPVANKNIKSTIHTSEAVSLARKIADESIVLLKNEKQILPLDVNKLNSIAIIGPNASILQVGDYSWSKGDTLGNTPLNGIKQLVGNKIKVNFAKGCDLTSQDSTGFKQAVQVAATSDIALVFVGSQSASLARDYFNSTSGEGFDLSDLKLPGVQEELLRAVSKTGTPTVLVLVTGKPFEVNWAKRNLPAILVQFYGGEQQGSAIANVIFGKVNPSGKLPVSIPQSASQLPVYYNYYPTDKGFYNQKGAINKAGRDYVFSTPYAAYTFGYGMSYTTFSLENIKLNKEIFNEKDTLQVTLNISNTGNFDGKEVVQLYVRDLYSSIVRPIKELKAFNKIAVPKGEKRQIILTLPLKELAFYNAESSLVVEPGVFEIQIGTSSDSIFYRKNIVINDMDEKVNPFSNLPMLDKSQTTASLGKEINVKGIISDIQATRIPYVYVSINGKQTLTGKDGKFNLKARIGEKLVFSKNGFRTIEKTITEDGVINITMITN